MTEREPKDSGRGPLSWQDVDNVADGQPPHLHEPVVVAAFEGWNDAGDAASTAIEHLELSWDATPLAAIDPEDYYDFQVTRPTIHLVEGITRHIEWPTTRLSVCRPPGADHDVVLIRGIEPNMRWRAFCGELIDYLGQLTPTTVVTLGALLTDTPHSRPVPVTGTTYDTASASRFGLETSRYTGPTGIVGVFQDACVQAGIPAISFWAAVPHYVSQAPDPKAAVALLHRVEEVLDLEVPLGGLPAQAEAWERTVSEMADADDEVREYVRSLEERVESESTLPEASGDTIAADFERYLRRRGPGGSGGPGGRSGGRGGPRL
ncbi:MAG: PAC2 family protein [Pseudonocardia sp.]|jgi:proteasome assembly chaperone (PAC2) family protein